LVTAHRRESWGEGLEAIARALARLARDNSHWGIIFPIHPNPVIRSSMLPYFDELANVLVIDPLPYLPFAHLIKRARIVITDSGGIQEEAPSIGRPALVMRETTERPEAVEAGTVRLVGTNEERIVAEAQRLIDDRAEYLAMARAVNPYGDGLAAPRSVASVANFLGLGPRPEEFNPGSRRRATP